MSYTHILAPIDFSDPANHALLYAFEEAAAHDAKLTLLHVMPHHTETEVHYVQGDPEVRSGMDSVVGFPPQFDPETGGILPTLRAPEPVTVRRDYTEETLTRLRDLVPGAFTGSWDAQVVDGNPADEIIRIAQDHDVDLIVVGTHGRTGLAHVLIGSVAEKVLRHAPCPVLVTRERK